MIYFNSGNNEHDETEIFNALFEAIQDVAFICFADGSITDVNQNGQVKLGYDEDDLLGKHLLDLTPPGAAAEAYDALWDLTPENNKASFESMLLNSFNEKIPVEVHCQFLGVKEGSGISLVTYRDIAYRAEIERVLARGQSRYKEILDASPEGFLMIDPHGRILEVNEAYARISGYTKIELLTMSYIDLLMAKNISSGEYLNGERSLYNNFIKTKTNELVPVQVKMSPGRDKNGLDTVLVFVNPLYDYLHLLEKTRQENRFMEKFLAGITNQDTTGIWIYRIGQGIRYTNDYFKNALGYTEAELASISAVNIYHPEDYDMVIEALAKVIDGSNPKYSGKCRFVRKDKSIIKTDLQVQARKDDAGNELLLCQIDNISALDESIKMTNDNDLHGLITGLNVSNSTGILIAEMGSNKYVYSNPLIIQKLGFSKSELEDIKPAELVYKDDFLSVTKNSLKLVVGFQKEVKFPCRYNSKDGGAIAADLTVTKYKDKTSKKNYMVILLDNIKKEELAAASA